MFPLGVFGSLDTPDSTSCRVQRHSVPFQSEYAILKGHLRRSVQPRVNVTDHGRNPTLYVFLGEEPSWRLRDPVAYDIRPRLGPVDPVDVRSSSNRGEDGIVIPPTAGPAPQLSSQLG
eukprot:3495279-Rhodomonas_salina.1